MAEDKSTLDELVDYLNENQRKRSEEMQSISDDGPGSGKPFTKKIKAENPNIPESDVQDYVGNVKDDMTNYIAGATMGASPALKLGSKIEGMAAKLPDASRFRELLDHPMVQKLREPFKQQRNMDMSNATAQEMKAIANKNIVPERALPAVDEVSGQRAYKNWMDEKLANETELAAHNNQGKIQNAIQEYNQKQGISMDPRLEQTQPAVPQELIEELLRRKMGN